MRSYVVCHAAVTIRDTTSHSPSAERIPKWQVDDYFKMRLTTVFGSRCSSWGETVKGSLNCYKHDMASMPPTNKSDY